jgi:class 3 adenylate cyclase
MDRDVGIGVASGEEFVGNVGGGGYKDFAAVGDVTNVAARLTSNARATGRSSSMRRIAKSRRRSPTRRV